MLLVLDVDADSTLTDPHDVAANIVEAYNDDRTVSAWGGPPVEFVSAEWIGEVVRDG
jgi:hypothetical protein